jgi:hypothetical protein
MTFDEWNRQETNRLCAREDKDIARHVRAARAGGLARFTLWDDYAAAASREGFTIEVDNNG